jgi:hypothetical protein
MNTISFRHALVALDQSETGNVMTDCLAVSISISLSEY